MASLPLCQELTHHYTPHQCGNPIFFFFILFPFSLSLFSYKACVSNASKLPSHTPNHGCFPFLSHLTFLCCLIFIIRAVVCTDVFSQGFNESYLRKIVTAGHVATFCKFGASATPFCLLLLGRQFH